MLSSPFAPVIQQWREKLKIAAERKWAKFGDYASEAMAFYDGPHDFLYGQRKGRAAKGFTIDDESMSPPSFMMTVNKVAELVQLFGPVLYHKNPIRQVNPRKVPETPPDMAMQDIMAQMQQQMGPMMGPQLGPMMAPQPGMPPMDPMQLMQMQAQQVLMQQHQQLQMLRETDKSRAELLEFYLNYTPNALDLKDHARSAIDEALIKGMGILWTELYQPLGLDIVMVGSFFETVDNILVDPDAEDSYWRDARWIARRRIQPVWYAEKIFNLPRGTLKGNLESINRYAENMGDEDAEYWRRRGFTSDLIVYWDVYSKMGMGGPLAGVPKSMRDQLDQFGDYCYLAISDETPYPLNLPPADVENASLDVGMLKEKVDWPTPFWADGTWPCTPIMFHPTPRCVWPMSHIRPALGELKFLDWAYSFIASKIRIACRDFLAVQKSASEELKNIILTGKDYTLIEIEKHHGTISDVVQFLQHPPFQGDIMKVIQAIEMNFEKRTGLMELAYGQTAHAYRSASEAEVKKDLLNVRPEDMASRVEEAMTDLARKEALAARWHLQAKDVLPIMGPEGAQLWQRLLETSDPAEVLYSLEYRIEAGSARKPNRERDAANMQQALQIMYQPLFQYAIQTGNVGPYNQLLSDWAKTIDLEADAYALSPPPPPPPMPPPGAPGPSGPPQGAPGPGRVSAKDAELQALEQRRLFAPQKPVAPQ